MKHCLVALILLTGSNLTTTPVHAQVQQGDFRLALEMNAFAFTAARVRASAGNGFDVTGKSDDVTFGPLGADSTTAGFTFGYAATSSFVPSVYLGFGRFHRENSTEVEGDKIDSQASKQSYTRFEVRPNLEIPIEMPFAPSLGVVPFARAGMSYVHTWQKSKIKDDSGTTYNQDGLGPLVGLGVHAFAGPLASFDASFDFRALFITNDHLTEQWEMSGVDNVKIRQYTIMLNLGASLWL